MEQRHGTQQHVQPPWWLSGEETCEFCAQQYTLEVEFRCVDCDRPICPMCVVVVRESHRVVCPECHPDAAGES